MKKLKRPFKVVTSPVMTCTNPDEAQKLFKSWKKVLDLSDWNIFLYLVGDNDLNGDLGEARVNSGHKCGIINITSHKQEEGKTFLECFEETLVHELLHFKFLAMDSLRGDDDMHRYFYDMEHQTLSKLAHAFVCTKYNLHPKWDWNKEGSLNVRKL